MARGPFSTTDLAVNPLKTEFTRLIEQHNEDDRNFKSLLCNVTQAEYVQVNQAAARFHALGSDTAEPEADHHDAQTITLRKPKRYGHKSAVTREAFDNGVLDEEMVRESQANEMRGDNRLVSEWCVYAMLTSGGWWDGTAIPPEHKSSTFLVSHTHYLAYNVGGTPTKAHFNAGKHHILEHGFRGDLVVFMNSRQAQAIEDIAEWATAPGPMATKLLEDLQRYGMTAEFLAAGMPVIIDDWFPEEYACITSLEEKPLHWRVPMNNAGVLEMYDAAPVPDVSYMYNMNLVRYCSATVTKRSMGVAMYFDGAAYVDPTFSDLEL